MSNRTVPAAAEGMPKVKDHLHNLTREAIRQMPQDTRTLVFKNLISLMDTAQLKAVNGIIQAVARQRDAEDAR